MSMMDNFLRAMKLNPSDEDDIFDDDYEEEVPARRPAKKRALKDASVEIEEKPSRNRQNAKVTPMKNVAAQRGRNGSVTVIKPTTMDDGREITETLLDNRTVVLNLEGLDMNVAQRIIDFTSGAIYALNGNLQKISQYIIIATPASVDISGDITQNLNGIF